VAVPQIDVRIYIRCFLSLQLKEVLVSQLYFQQLEIPRIPFAVHPFPLVQSWNNQRESEFLKISTYMSLWGDCLDVYSPSNLTV